MKRVFPCYWKLNDDSVGSVQSGFPSWFSHLVYGMPVLEYPGLMKICGHWGEPRREEYEEMGAEYVAPIKSFIETRMRDVDAAPAVVEECFYTCTPDNMFILDVHPQYKNIVIGAGFSGGGFKMSPVTGSVLGQLALGEDSGYDISSFSISRFINTKSRL